ncbi:MAG: LTA synthase family protein [Bacillus sp. (in: Bacteria)]|nr:LTA synthase family protein [Bacillus sp. (in: firmicutes)]
MASLNKMIKGDSLLIYFLISILFMDTIFRVIMIEEPFSFDAVISTVFLIAIAILLFLICSFFKAKAGYLLSIVLLGLVATIYFSQLIYFEFFRSFYSLYSVGNGAQVFDFWKDIAAIIVGHSLWILLFFFPVFLLILFGKRLLTFDRIDGYNRLSLVCCLIFAHLTGIGAVYAGGKDLNSAYDLYFKNSYPLLAVERLGLITTMRVDLQRLVVGWSPTIEILSPNEPSQLQTPPPSLEAQPSEQVPEEEKIKYNVMDIDFSQLIATEKNQTVNDMHHYFETVQPTSKNKYTGKYKGYNLIFLTAEAFSPYAINKDVTPTLYKLVNEGYNFTNFYNPSWGVSTSDGEYVATTGLIPKSGVWSFKQSGSNFLPFVMGNQLKKLNYKTLAFHNHTYTYYGRDISHPNMGYIYKGLGNGLAVKETWPASDLEMLEKTIPEYINSQPFHTYYMTVSGHMQYSFSGNYIANKNKKYVENLPFSLQGKAYIATQVELDRALKYLLTQLDVAGIANHTLIALSADHYPYGLDNKTIDELNGHTVEKNFEIYKSPFILYTNGMKPETVVKPTSSLDIIPTLSNLLGIEYDSRLLMGKDIFSDSAPLVTFLNKSFITDRGSYNAITKEFIASEGAETDEDYIKNISAIVQGKFFYSAKILETDYYRKIFEP